jgi:hypothetical protein
MKLITKYFIKSQESFSFLVRVARERLLIVKKKKLFILINKSFVFKKHPTGSSHFLNQKGISTLAPLVLSLGLSLGILYTYKAIKGNQDIRERKQIYLCLKETEFLKRNYVESMGQLNSVIRGAFYARAIPAITIYAQRIQQVAQYFQQFIHISQMKKAMSLKNCSSLVSLNYIRTLPYKSKYLRLVRRLDGSTPIRKKSWKEYLWSPHRNILLQSSVALKSRFSTELKVKRKEFSREALQSLKESYGQASSFSSF